MSRPKKHPEGYEYHKPMYPNLKTYREVSEIVGCSHAQAACTTTFVMKKILYHLLTDADTHSEFEGDLTKILVQLNSQFGFEFEMLARTWETLSKAHPRLHKYWSL
jgi:hypothetical protein